MRTYRASRPEAEWRTGVTGSHWRPRAQNPSAMITISAGTKLQPSLPQSWLMRIEPPAMNAGIEKSMPPTSTTSVWPAPARPRNAAATSIALMLDPELKSVTLTAPQTNSATKARSWNTWNRRCSAPSLDQRDCVEARRRFRGRDRVLVHDAHAAGPPIEPLASVGPVTVASSTESTDGFGPPDRYEPSTSAPIRIAP